MKMSSIILRQCIVGFFLMTPHAAKSIELEICADQPELVEQTSNTEPRVPENCEIDYFQDLMIDGSPQVIPQPSFGQRFLKRITNTFTVWVFMPVLSSALALQRYLRNPLNTARSSATKLYTKAIDAALTLKKIGKQSIKKFFSKKKKYKKA